jgi:hypothetical protein
VSTTIARPTWPHFSCGTPMSAASATDGEVAVVGLARSGRAAAGLLASRGAQVYASDTRTDGEILEASGQTSMPLLAGQVYAIPLVRLPTSDGSTYSHKDIRGIAIGRPGAGMNRTEIAILESYSTTSPSAEGLFTATRDFELIGGQTADAELRASGEGTCDFSLTTGARITSRRRGGGTKRRYRAIDFRRHKDGVPAKVAHIEYDPNRNGLIALLHYADGEKRYILLPARVKLGDTLILVSDPDFRDRWHDRADFLLVADLAGSPPAATSRAWIPVGLLLAVVALAATGVVPILQGALVAAILLVATRVL